MWWEPWGAEFCEVLQWCISVGHRAHPVLSRMAWGRGEGWGLKLAVVVSLFWVLFACVVFVLLFWSGTFQVLASGWYWFQGAGFSRCRVRHRMALGNHSSQRARGASVSGKTFYPLVGHAAPQILCSLAVEKYRWVLCLALLGWGFPFSAVYRLLIDYISSPKTSAPLSSEHAVLLWLSDLSHFVFSGLESPFPHAVTSAHGPVWPGCHLVPEASECPPCHTPRTQDFLSPLPSLRCFPRGLVVWICLCALHEKRHHSPLITQGPCIISLLYIILTTHFCLCVEGYTAWGQQIPSLRMYTLKSCFYSHYMNSRLLTWSSHAN